MVFEWYGFFVPFKGINWYFKLSLRVPSSPTKILLRGPLVLNDTQWYSVVYNWLFM